MKKIVDVYEYLSKFKTDRQLNSLNRDERLKYYNDLEVKELKMHFSFNLTGDAYHDLILVYNLKRGR